MSRSSLRPGAALRGAGGGEDFSSMVSLNAYRILLTPLLPQLCLH